MKGYFRAHMRKASPTARQASEGGREGMFPYGIFPFQRKKQKGGDALFSKKERTHARRVERQLYHRRISGGRHRRGTRGMRSRSRARKDGHIDRHADHEPRFHRIHALQPLHRRHGKGASRTRNRLARRGNGAERRQDRPADPHAERRKGCRGAVPACAIGQKRLSPRNEAHTGIVRKPAYFTGGSR